MLVLNCKFFIWSSHQKIFCSQKELDWVNFGYRYDLDSKDGTFKYVFGIEDLVSSVNFLDFSTDNSYILYKDNFGVLTVTNIIKRGKENLVHLEFDVEWVSDGIQESDKTKVNLTCFINFLNFRIRKNFLLILL